MWNTSFAPFTLHAAQTLLTTLVTLQYMWLWFAVWFFCCGHGSNFVQYCFYIACSHCNIVKLLFLAFILLLLLLVVAGTLQKRSFIILYCMCAHSAKSCFCYLCITHCQQIVESYFHYFYILCGSYPVDPFSCYFYIAFGLHVAEEYSCISCISSIYSSYSQRRRRGSSIGIK